MNPKIFTYTKQNITLPKKTNKDSSLVMTFLGTRRVLRSLILAASLTFSPLHGEERIWTSSTGTQLTAELTSYDGVTVVLRSSKGRVIKLALNKLSSEDQSYLKENHAPEAPEIKEATPPENLPIPLGQISGPIDTPEGKPYFIYLPKTMVAGEKAPLLLWVDAARSNANMLKRFLAIADLTGFALATPVGKLNSPNNWRDKKHKHTKSCLNHIAETLPIDTTRVIFSGGSGGGKAAWLNASKLPCIGVMPFIAHIPPKVRPPKGKFYYIATGASDWFRYDSARDAAKYGERAIHRLYPGGHTLGDRYWAEDGLLWLYSKHVYEKRSEFPHEIARFEARLAKHLTSLSAQRPHEAYYWTDFYLNQCPVSVAYRPVIQALHTELEKNPECPHYLAGRKELVRYSRKVLTGIEPRNSRGHITSKQENYAKKMKLEYAGLPQLPEIFEHLGSKTN